MFSITAINDTESTGLWEPLAPTKEAQEFHLCQTYHEGLLKLQAKDYAKARELLESVLQDQLISSLQADSNTSDGHLLQLRFLSLKNLATVFVEQGTAYYEKALHCYLQAIEIDTKDAVLWNQLGTLSCTMGLLSTSRWAFEQGLLWSPNNWNCMEKLLEVLIAIGDEVSCLSIADLILRHWPSHSRALHVKNTIENSEPESFAPHGIDKLEPKHVKLRFPSKRKAEDNMDENIAPKRCKQNLEVELAGATWPALIEAVFGIINLAAGKVPEPELAHDDDASRAVQAGEKYTKMVLGDTNSLEGNTVPLVHDQIERFANVNIDLRLPVSSEYLTHAANSNSSASFFGCEKLNSENEKEVYDKEQTHERRSTRLERLRSRKSGKEELELACSKDFAKIYKILEPFVFLSPTSENGDRANSYCCPQLANMTSSVNENGDVVRFIKATSKNLGAYHLGHILLDEVSNAFIPFQESLKKILEIEKMTRHWGMDRTPLCCLFLAELSYEYGSSSTNESERVEFFSDASYHLCKVIELVTLDHINLTVSTFDDRTIGPELSGFGGCYQDLNFAVVEDSLSQENNCNELKAEKSSSFWVRFFFLSGRLSLYSGFKERALKELCTCLSLLKNINKSNGTAEFVMLPHCKLVKVINSDLVLHEINLLRLDLILKNAITEFFEKEMYDNFIEMLSPLLLSTKAVYLVESSCSWRANEGDLSVELSGLDTLMMACEKSEHMDVQVYLDSQRRKLQICATAAGMLVTPMPEKGKDSLLFAAPATDSDRGEAFLQQRVHKLSEEVRHVLRSVSLVKHALDKINARELPCSLVCIIRELQHLIMSIMCGAVKLTINQKVSGSAVPNQMDQVGSGCLTDATIAFCKLQHLDPSVPAKTQVDLIIAVHGLLAEYGLCCSGKDGGGEEGSFLKLAIKHLLVLDAKVKSQLELETKHKESASCGANPREVLGGSTMSMLVGSDKQENGKKAEEIATEAVAIVMDSLDQDEEKLSENTAVGEKSDAELENVELSIESALDQCFFCLYGLNINPDSCSEDDLAIHKNTTHADYQTKEQCADVFQYILPYGKTLSRTGLVKLRRVFRAIRKHFPQPPDEILADNPIDKLLDGTDFCEDKLSSLSSSGASPEYISSILFPNGAPQELTSPKVLSSHSYMEVYSNLYYFIAQAEDISASDKYPGFVLKQEGEEFVEQNVRLFKYDLLYNPLRFESWQKLANIFDEEVDLLLNDGSKHINLMDWRKNTSLIQRVENGRRRSRRCLLMSLALAKTPDQQSQIHELLALVYYDNLQNVVPFYDQRFVIRAKDAAWMKVCQKSMEHFKKAFSLKPDWIHAFYLGKLCEKLGYSPNKALSYYSKSASLNISAVDPVYRLHASRLKLLYSSGKQNLDILQTVAMYAFNPYAKERVHENLKQKGESPKFNLNEVDDEEPKARDDDYDNHHSHQLDEAWHALYEDCLSAIGVCVEGELKHFHKARYMLAQGYYQRGEAGDLERSKDELSFCFKSSRSAFTVNMWEIDGTIRKGRRKNPGSSGSKKALEVSLSESSRKFMTCMRKYLLFYLTLLEKTGDLLTLEKAYLYLRTDKRFFLCLGDIVPVALIKYIQVLLSSIRNTESNALNDSISLEQLLEKMFNISMDHAHLILSDGNGNATEANNLELPEENLSRYAHQYINFLESNARLDSLETVNEKIRKRLKSQKMSSNTFTRLCKHVSLSWFRAILVKLVSLTLPPHSSENVNDRAACSENDLLLYVDLEADELLSSSPEGVPRPKGIDMNMCEAFSKIKNIHVKQALEEDIESAMGVLRCSYSYYRDTSSMAVLLGLNLYAVPPSPAASSRLESGSSNPLELSIPRKLLLWAYALVHGRYANISTVLKFCEENAKSRLRRGGTESSGSQPSSSSPHQQGNTGGVRRERIHRDKLVESENSPVIMLATPAPTLNRAEAEGEPLKSKDPVPRLHQCSSIKATEGASEDYKPDPTKQ